VIASGVRAKVEGYVDSVLCGDTVACDRVKDAVNRYVSDLQRQSTLDFPYHFDERWATCVCEFFPGVLRHSIGEFAGRPIVLEPWQAFCIWNIFGWKRDDDKSRRFRKIYWSMGRKNGKSTVAAGLCLFLASGDIDPATGKPEAVGQILLTATKKEQAAVVYGECERMRLQSSAISKMTDVRNETITFKHNKTYIRKVSSDKPYSGLNPTLVVMDEVHEWGQHHRKFYDTMVTGSGSRTQPLHLIITTAGADDSYLWLENYNYACEVLRGNFKDESMFAIVYEFDEKDDPGDESVWIKSNPNLGVSIKTDYLRERWNEDQHTSIGRNRFVRYHGNRIVSSTDKAFDIAKFDACVHPLSDWSTADALGAGLDLGSRDDLAAYALCARFPVETDTEGKTVYRYEIKCRTYIASDSKRNLSEMPFAGWVYSGELRKFQYPLSELEKDLDEEMAAYGITTLAYDPYNGQVTGESLAQKGIVAARMAQTAMHFNEPIRDFTVLMNEARLRFEDSKLLRWCFNNAAIARDRQDRYQFCKRESREKIDPVVATVMAYRVASMQPARTDGSLYVD
jgi:phage terminase large subunit-like protein